MIRSKGRIIASGFTVVFNLDSKQKTKMLNMNKKPKNIWKNRPPHSTIDQIIVPDGETFHLRNGIKCLGIFSDTQEITKLDILFPGGRLAEVKKLAARYCFLMFREGTKSKTAHQLEEWVDFHGGNLRIFTNLDYSSISVSFLSKYATKLIPLIGEMISEPRLDAENLEKLQKINIQKLELEMMKAEMISYKVITEKIFGTDHPYGYNSTSELIQGLSIDDLQQQYQRHFGIRGASIFISGYYTDHILKCLEDTLGQITKTQEESPFILPESEEKASAVHILHESEYQTAIKIGRKLFKRQHEDYPGFFMVNTILGGYFGSRLMSSVREDLGYTYNIYSSTDHLTHGGYFVIATEVAHQYAAATIQEIQHQIQLLQNELVSPEELSMVRNYLMGNFLTLIDGPFNQASLHRSLMADGSTVAQFNDFVEQIKTIEPEQIRQLAQKYLMPESLWTITVGPAD